MAFRFENSHIVQKVIKNNNDDIIAYKLENGEIIMKEEAISMAAQGIISGITFQTDDRGNKYLECNIEDGNNAINTTVNHNKTY